MSGTVSCIYQKWVETSQAVEKAFLSTHGREAQRQLRAVRSTRPYLRYSCPTGTAREADAAEPRMLSYQHLMKTESTKIM